VRVYGILRKIFLHETDPVSKLDARTLVSQMSSEIIGFGAPREDL